jgi:hypothetical protein
MTPVASRIKDIPSPMHAPAVKEAMVVWLISISSAVVGIRKKCRIAAGWMNKGAKNEPSTPAAVANQQIDNGIIHISKSIADAALRALSRIIET